MSEQNQHTPGPWIIRGGVGVWSKHTFVATTDPHGKGDSPIRIANAHLIAAAPELLEAVDSAIRALDMISGGMNPQNVIEQTGATAALVQARRKARGKGPEQ